MILWDILSAFFIGLIFTGIFVVGFGRERGWSSIFASLFLIFLAVWAGGRWTSQLYLFTNGAFWLPMLIIGLLIILVLAAIIPARLENQGDAVSAGKNKPVGNQLTHYGFWVTVVFLIIAIVAGYLSFAEHGSLSLKKSQQYLNGPDTLKNWKHRGAKDSNNTSGKQSDSIQKKDTSDKR
jgi:small-conductance mechanosensitive channel